MMRRFGFGLLLVCALANTAHSSATAETLRLTLRDAERDALQTSNRLKSFGSDADAATELADSQFTTLLPRLALQGNYQHLGTVPTLSIINGMPPVRLTSNTSYSIGPVLSYTLWDTFSSLKSYRGYSRLAEARQEDRKSAQLQLLHSVRGAYVQVQLALEELRLVNGSRQLARAQNRDITTRVRAGAASRLDLVTANRQVIGYELQFKQKQAELSAALKDLLALVSGHDLKDVSHPGPPGVENVSLALNLDSQKTTLEQQEREDIAPPDDRQPQLRSQELVAESFELSAASQKAKLLPLLQASAGVSLAYPNGPVLQQIHQNTVMVSLTMPLYLGDPTWHLASQKLKDADTARYREDQLRIDLQRDFSKTRELLTSLQDQRKLAAQDVEQSEEAARLYYSSYKAGKNNLIDVQTANNQALQAEVGAARIDAAVLNQLITLKALSGKDVSHE